MITSIVAALREHTQGSEMLAEVDFNAELAQPEGARREEEIAAALTESGLEYMLAHLMTRRNPWCQDGRMWIMVMLGRELRSRTDHILGTDHRLFKNVSVWDPSHNSDHNMIMGYLRSAPLR